MTTDISIKLVNFEETLVRMQRDETFNFIKTHFTKEEFDKFKSAGKMTKFSSYEEFLQDQHKGVENLHRQELGGFHATSLNLTATQGILVMDKSNVKLFVIDGFIIANGTLVYTGGQYKE